MPRLLPHVLFVLPWCKFCNCSFNWWICALDFSRTSFKSTTKFCKSWSFSICQFCSNFKEVSFHWFILSFTCFNSILVCSVCFIIELYESPIDWTKPSTTEEDLLESLSLFRCKYPENADFKWPVDNRCLTMTQIETSSTSLSTLSTVSTWSISYSNVICIVGCSLLSWRKQVGILSL